MKESKILLRLSNEMHALLKARAKQQHVSVNKLIADRVVFESAGCISPDIVSSVVVDANKMFGKNLVGVLVFGSFARGEHNDSSDIDVLIVLDRRVKITRSLYHDWDGFHVSQPGCEVHIVAFPKEPDSISGFWAEIALDGIVVWNRDFDLYRYLCLVRHKILEEEITSKKFHGQRHWARKVV